ncbi:MAG: type II toxin-antitoxin system PemK/MazF family toxin [Candidatus Binataceae bacterium]
MPPTTRYRRGDVVLVPFPFTDLTGAKQRPALVVSSDTNNASRADLVIAAITSQLPAALASDEIAVPAGGLAVCGLPKPSIVRTAKLVTIHQALIRKRIGSMPRETLERVLAAIRNQFKP